MNSDSVSPDALTYVFTDIVGSTERWEHDPKRMGAAVRASEELQASHIDAHRGAVVKHTGDGLSAAFAIPSDAVHAAGAIQLESAGLDWQHGGLPLRIGMNTGESEHRVGDYFGSAVNLAARVMSVASGGQVLISEHTAELARTGLAPDYSLQDVGDAWLRGFEHPHRLVQLAHRDLRSDFSRFTARAEGERSLPTTTTNLIGRDREVAAVMKMLAPGHLVTLVGPPGVGKTRLAVEVARRVAERWPHGLAWCSLESATTAEQALHTIAAEIDVDDLGDDPDADIVAHLARREFLLVLDNAEHLVDAVRHLVNRVIEACPNVGVFVTSQQALRVHRETIFTVEPLQSGRLGAASGPAEALFIDRAESTGVHMDVSDDGRRRVGELCARLDGIPLAIELAAARARSMTLTELGAALDRRFSLLTTRDRGTIETDRHRTLYGAIEWAYELLGHDERALFELLGVFSGGARFDPLNFMAGRVGIDDEAVADTLWQLVEKSLVQTDTSGEATRFTMLSSVRAFALDRLAGHDALSAAQDAHAAYFLSFAETAERERGGPDERIWVDAQLREFENLRGAVSHAVSTGDVDTALRIFVAMYEIASMQGRVEVFDWVAPTELIDSGHELLPAALAMSGLRHDPLEAASLETAEEAIGMFEVVGGREHRILPFARGFAEASRRNFPAARTAYDEAARVVEETEGRNGRWVTARCLTAIHSPDVEVAERLVDDAQQIGQPTGVAFAFLVLARALRDERPKEALRLIDEAQELSSTVYNRHVGVYVDLGRAGVLSHGAQPQAALEYLLRALDSTVELRQHESMWRCVREIASTLRRLELDALAEELLLPWVGRYPDGIDAAMQRFDLTEAPIDAFHEPASFEELVTHSHAVVTRVFDTEDAVVET